MSKHIPVLLEEVIEGLEAVSNAHFLDATFGGGGHSRVILECTSPNGRVFGIDLDVDAIQRAQKLQMQFGERLVLAHGNFKDFPQLMKEHEFDEKLSGVLCDLGFSSDELESKGMSFLEDAPLDMRYSDQAKETAADILNQASLEELEEMFRTLAEEKLSKKIASRIVKARSDEPFTRTKQLADFVSDIYAHSFKKPSRKHPATKVFQALRMKVNDELGNLQAFLENCLTLPSGCRIAIISFHSVEDRVVKRFFKEYAKDVIGEDGRTIIRPKQLEIINKKVIIASEEEIQQNPRSRSAKLRLAKLL